MHLLVLRVDGQEFRLHLLAGHQVHLLQVELDSHHLGRHEDGAARGAASCVVQINRHFHLKSDESVSRDDKHSDHVEDRHKP